MNDLPSDVPAQNKARTRSGVRGYWPVTRFDLLISILITFLGFVARIYSIGASSLWVDEAASLAFSRMDWTDLFTTLPAIETNPPVYYAILNGWTSLAGTSETALRMPSALAGTASVFILFLIALKQYGRTAAIVAAGFLAVSALHVSYAQEARVTPMVTLLFTIGLGLVNALISRLQNQQATWVLFLALSVVAAALPYLHYSAFFVAIVLGCYALLRLFFGGHLRAVAGRIGAVAVLVLLLAFPPLFWAFELLGHADSPAGWLKPPSFWDAKYVFHQALGHGYLPFGRAGWLPADVQDSSAVRLLATRRLAELSLFLICCVGVLISLRQRENSIPALLITLGVVIILFFGISQAKPILIERTITYSTPMLAMIAGYSVSVMRWRPLVIVAAFNVIGFQAVNLSAYYPRAEKEPWRALFARTESNYRADNAVIFASGPYLSPTISTAILAEYYWAGLPKQHAFTLQPAVAGRLHALGLSLTPWVKDLNLQTACAQLGANTGIIVIFRRSEDAEQLVQTLGALNSRLLSQTTEGELGFELWSATSCT
ncbi:glycosyltransferase family 39 protein [Sulfitobacter sp.]|uniref:glycosyltransferase family 39 protein n=1 Tax=Sulfitobacter sp. TaxID=1903071 RepID=UPI003002D2BE